MEVYNGKWRYTSPTHTLLAFPQALEELADEGGVQARYQRYLACQKALVQGMRSLGFAPLLDDDFHSPIITAFFFPQEAWFDFSIFYQLLKQRLFVIYPGKVSDHDTFRIGTIGDLNLDDIDRLISAVQETVLVMKADP